MRLDIALVAFVIMAAAIWLFPLVAIPIGQKILLTIAAAGASLGVVMFHPALQD